MKPLASRDYPVGHLLNPATPYVPSAHTDVARTFARVRQERAARRARIVGSVMGAIRAVEARKTGRDA